MLSSAAERCLRVLHLEDSELDHELTIAQLRRGGLNVASQRIDSEPEFLRALEGDWDVVISDYNLPGFSGLVALDLLKASGLAVPFILLSGAIGEDAAVEAMRNGASDYLLKNNMTRLVPALLRAVEANETRLARRLADHEARQHRRQRERRAGEVGRRPAGARRDDQPAAGRQQHSNPITVDVERGAQTLFIIGQ